MTRRPTITAPLILGAILAATPSLRALETNGLAAAQTLAASSHRPILILFTGGDWCPWSAALKSQVLDTPEFKEFANARLVVVTVDLPKSTLPAPESTALMARYGVRGLPAAVLTDAAGTARCVLGYEKGGPRPFLARLGAFIPER